MAKTQKPNSQTIPRKPNWLQDILVIGFLIGIGLTSYSAGRWGVPGFPAKQAKPIVATVSPTPKTLYDDYRNTEQSGKTILSMERAHALRTVNSNRLQTDLAEVDSYFGHARPVEAMWLLASLRGYIQADHDFVQRRLAELASAQKAPSKPLLPVATAHADMPTSTNIPILLYHKTPIDFEKQLMQLRDRGYTTITMAQVACGLHKTCALPAKPVVITFDDGFSDQLTAFALLQKYRMRATFYMIIGGNKSNHCIGITREPSAPCGDAYLNWDQVIMLQRSGIIEIGAHTMDHLNLASLSASDQAWQIAQSKLILEQTLGIPVTTLAYPYGAFNSISVQAAQQAGFSTAVSTLPGSDQSLSTIFALHRVRDTYKLP